MMREEEVEVEVEVANRARFGIGLWFLIFSDNKVAVVKQTSRRELRAEQIRMVRSPG